MTNLSKQQVLSKLQRYCAYQERCESEAQQKLKDLGIYGALSDEIIEILKEELFIDNHRYALLFASNKFRLKKWGKIKIEKALQQKKIKPILIQEALAEIDETDYIQTINYLLDKKRTSLLHEKKEKPSYIIQQKLAAYLLQKGYEREKIWKCIKG
jgi:regulatory protein